MKKNFEIYLRENSEIFLKRILDGEGSELASWAKGLDNTGSFYKSYTMNHVICSILYAQWFICYGNILLKYFLNDH